MFAFIDIIIKGGPVMAPLLGCSIFALTVVIERWLYWRRIGDRRLAETLLELVERGELSRAAESTQQADAPLVRVIASGIAHRNAVTKALEVAAQKEVPVLKRRLTILDTIITLAPLLGLLGTVTGMIGSFGIMSQAGIGQPHAVTGGVAEALIATIAGLAVAIPALACNNFLAGRLAKLEDNYARYQAELNIYFTHNWQREKAKIGNRFGNQRDAAR